MSRQPVVGVFFLSFSIKKNLAFMCTCRNHTEEMVDPKVQLEEVGGDDSARKY